MRLLVDHHHYKSALIPQSDRVAIYERYVIDLLTINPLPDEKRESSIAFELKHHHSTAQFARIFARKRNLPEDVCVVGALLHDVSVIINGTYKNHAHESAKIAQEILDKLGLFSQNEKAQILKIIYNHSDKEVFSNDKFEEFGKDVDVLDSFLYPNAFGYYLKNKRLSVFKCYIQRAELIWKEIGLDIPCDFSVLNNYNEQWLNKTIISKPDVVEKQLSVLLQLVEEYREKKLFPIPTFAIHCYDNSPTFYFNSKSYDAFISNMHSALSTASELHDLHLCTDLKPNQEHVNMSKELILKAHEAIVLIWSAIDSYELLNTSSDSGRIFELGIKL